HGSNGFVIAGGVWIGLGLLMTYSQTAYSDPGIVKRMKTGPQLLVWCFFLHQPHGVKKLKRMHKGDII
ncbi:MAG: hypothetical protein MJA29_10660, partial [Candidatus Omnitrophica bacterium]|nr:hypothetical protein [Candidatus Omnitrophota bacterium]